MRDVDDIFFSHVQPNNQNFGNCEYFPFFRHIPIDIFNCIRVKTFVNFFVVIF